MKKNLLVLGLLLFSVFCVNAQAKQAVGIRLGGNIQHGGVEASLHYSLNDISRVELSVMAPGFSGIYVSGNYHFVNDLSNLVPSLSCYYGAGVGAGYVASFLLGAHAIVGLEYNFDFPLQLTLDARPGLNIIPFGFKFNLGFFGLGARYRF